MLYYWRYHIIIFFAGSCEIKENCYACLPLTTISRDEFSQKKFWSIKKGMKFDEVSKLIGKPYDIEIWKDDDYEFIANYTDWRKNKYIDYYVMFYIYYTKDSLVYRIDTSEDE
ncbi:MAG: hypothetical protein K1X55_16065 [Chitinophagales bacterium]|nr:hypothetical protein [Chitinophagales bacterium]